MRLPLRFSLRSLLLLILAGAAAVAAGMKWEAWQLKLTLTPTGNSVSQAKFSSDGRLIVTHGSGSAQVLDKKNVTVVWNRAGEELYRTDWCYNMGASGYDGAEFKYGSRYLLLVFAHHGSNSQLVDLNTKKMLFPEMCTSGYVSFSRDGRRCAVAHRDEPHRCWIAVYDLEDGKVLREERVFFESSKRECREVRISPDGRRVVAIAEETNADKTIEGFLIQYDVETGAIAKARQQSGEFYIDDLAFSEDGSRVVVWNHYGELFRVLDASTNAVLFESQSSKRIGYDYRRLREGLRYILYEWDGTSFWLDLNAKELKPVPIPGVKLSDSRVIGEWLAWDDQAKLRLMNFVSGRIPYVELDFDKNSNWWSMYELQRCLILHTGNAGRICFHQDTHSVFQSYDDLAPSPDSTRILCMKRERGANLFALHGGGPPCGVLDTTPGFATWAPDSNSLIAPRDGGSRVGVWTRVRNDAPGAFLRLPELWLAIAFALAFIWSVYDNVRRVRGSVGEAKTP